MMHDKHMRHIIFAAGKHGLEKSISLVLKMATFKVTVVDSCLDAYEIMNGLAEAGTPPDLLIIDFARETELGERFVDSVKEAHMTLPIIVITEYGDENLIGEGLTSRCNLLLSKPFEPQELLRGIDQVFEPSQTRG